MAIDPAMKSKFLAELRDIENALLQIMSLEDVIKATTSEAKEKYGITGGAMKAIAKKRIEDKLADDIEQTANLLDWKEIAKES